MPDLLTQSARFVSVLRESVGRRRAGKLAQPKHEPQRTQGFTEEGHSGTSAHVTDSINSETQVFEIAGVIAGLKLMRCRTQVRTCSEFP